MRDNTTPLQFAMLIVLNAAVTLVCAWFLHKHGVFTTPKLP